METHKIKSTVIIIVHLIDAQIFIVIMRALGDV